MKTLKEAYIYGKVSKANTKMPGTSFPLDAFDCHTGGKLRPIEGTPCHHCYAIRIQKFRPNVDKAWKLNSEKARHWLDKDPDLWVESMVFQIDRAARLSDVWYHRWFDSGDLQGTTMLKAITNVCRQTPRVSHWLPTQERKIVIDYLKDGALPYNLTVRVSASKINPVSLPSFGNTSSVHTKTFFPKGHVCPASQQDNNCGKCRACWDWKVDNISYLKH